jgi:hypothetical protein
MNVYNHFILLAYFQLLSTLGNYSQINNEYL